MEKYCYHLITDLAEFERQFQSGKYEDASLKREGFIHLCFKSQILPVIDRFYRDISSFLILRFQVELLHSKCDLRVEHPIVDEGNLEEYPHLYGEIFVEHVDKKFEIKRKKDGRVALPSSIEN